MAEERLQKILATAGIASRRKAEGLIVEGRVTVNGKVVDELGSKADPEVDHIKVDGRLIKQPDNLGARKIFSMAMWMAALVAPLQMLAGDTQGRNTLEYQPMKVLAMEGDYDPSPDGAPLVWRRGRLPRDRGRRSPPGRALGLRALDGGTRPGSR